MIGVLEQPAPGPGGTVEGEQAQVVTLPGTFNIQRGFVAVPAGDVRAYVREQALALGLGFAVGVGVGVLFGNVFKLVRV